MQKNVKDEPDFVSPLIISGLKGRVLRMPHKKAKKREILLIYGHHSSIERMYGFADFLSNYGNVTMPDLPGFGGMDSFYKIGEKPTLDNLADYLATFIKLNFRNKKIIIGGMSFGFIVATRMFQKHPETTNQVSLLVSLAGFSHHKDFKLKKRTIFYFKLGSYIGRNRLPAAIIQHLFFRKSLIRLVYYMLASKNLKIKDADKLEKKRRIDFEVVLWQSNDFRTYCATTITMMKLDLTAQRVSAPLLSIVVAADQFFDRHRVEKHFKQIYSKVQTCPVKLPNHAPTVVSTADEVKHLFSKEIIKIINRTPEN